MIFMKKNNAYGYDFIISKHFRIFTEVGEWFFYIELPNYTIRFSSVGCYLYNKNKNKYFDF